MQQHNLPKGGNEPKGNCGLPPLFAIIVAGGSGLRAGGGLPKQFHNLCGIPVFMHSVKAFLKVCPDTHIIIVTHQDYQANVTQIVNAAGVTAEIVTGGKSRWESVKNGLEAINSNEGLVAIHDAARPLVRESTISEGWQTALQIGGGVPCIPVTDSLRKFSGEATESVDRSLYLSVQTPQVFELNLLREAYNAPYKETFTDDASVIEDMGREVTVFPGSADNIKITHPEDFKIAELLLASRK